MTENEDRRHTDVLANLASNMVRDLLELDVEADRIEIQFVTGGTYQVIVQERGHAAADPLIVS